MISTRKTGEITGLPPGYSTRFRRGHDPRRGCGKKGRSGRKPDAFKALCRTLASSNDVFGALASILSNVNHPAFIQALKFVATYGYGSPSTSKTLIAEASAVAVQRWVWRDQEILF